MNTKMKVEVIRKSTQWVDFLFEQELESEGISIPDIKASPLEFWILNERDLFKILTQVDDSFFFDWEGNSLSDNSGVKHPIIFREQVLIDDILKLHHQSVKIVLGKINPSQEVYHLIQQLGMLYIKVLSTESCDLYGYSDYVQLID